MSCCCHSQPVPAALPVKVRRAGGGEWVALALLLVLSGLAMNLNLAVNVSALDGSTRLFLHGLLALGGLVAVALGGTDLFAPAWQALRERRVVTEHLFLAGIAAAWGVSVHATLTGRGAVFYEVPILLPAIRRFGGIVLGRQRADLAKAAREMLAGISHARVRLEDGWLLQPLSAVREGDEILVKAGEASPVDGRILAGSAYVQTLALTGEPFPASLGAGDGISAGMTVLDGDLRLRATGSLACSELSRLAAATQDLLERPQAFLRSTERVLRWFFPAVLLVSGLTCGFWAWHAGWPEAVAHSLAVVLVACPCAFGVALPLLYRRGVAACLRRGIEPEGAGFLERLSMAQVAAFDKTGTLTTSDMQCTALLTAPGADAKLLRQVLAALQSRSTHPVSRPFWGWAGEAAGVEVRNLRSLPGLGIEAEVRVRAGWLKVRLGHEGLLHERLPSWAAGGGGQRRLFVEMNDRLTGACILSETLRPSAAETCGRLAGMGYQVALLTGDATVPPPLALAFNEVHTAQRPADKAAHVRGWEQAGKPVLFIGDGLNDTPALAAATASIALGETTDAQARWRNPDLALLPGLCEETRTLAARARLILKTALAYNALGMAAAACGLLHPVAATAIMLASSATVTALAARD